MHPPRSRPEPPRPAVPFEQEWHRRFVEFATLHEDDAGIAGWSLSGLQTRLRFFRRHWRAPVAPALYLDVGCGAGTYARWLAEQGMRVVGLDYSIPTLVKARGRTPQTIGLCAGDALNMPFADAVFDGVLCFGLLQAVSDSGAVVRELARVVKPGGELWIDALNGSGAAARIERARLAWRGKGIHLRYESPRHVAHVLGEAGFGELHRYWLPIVPAQLLRLQAAAESPIARSAFAVLPPLGSLLSHAFVFRAKRLP